MINAQFFSKRLHQITIFSFLATAFVIAISATASASSGCIVPRIATEFAKATDQLAQCEKNKALPFCSDAEDYEPYLKPEEAIAAWQCLAGKGALEKGFPEKLGKASSAFKTWKAYNTRPYLSGHLNRFADPDAVQAIYVQNLVNEKGTAYGKFEKSGKMPEGAVLAKYSLVLTAKGGTVELAPAYFMTKLKHGSRKETGDWLYEMVWPVTVDLTQNKANLEFTEQLCMGCHEEFGRKTDHMLFMPKEVRVKKN